MLIILLCAQCLQASAQIRQEDHVVGTTLTIGSGTMIDKIQVFLPETYSASDKHYPVLYILDGQRYFLHGVSLQKTFVDFGMAPEFIVVGIWTKVANRNRQFSSRSREYRSLLEQEVIDYVDQQYRTSEKRILFGWAYGGGFVLETLIDQPDLFDVYISASPFPVKDKMAGMDSLLTHDPRLNTSLLFSSGTNEGMVTAGTNELNAFLSERAPSSMNWTFMELTEEEHRSTPFTTLYHGLKKAFRFYPELQFSSLNEFTEAGGLSFVYDYYENRASKFGFPNELSDWTMFSIVRNAIRVNDYTQFSVLMNEFRETGFIHRLRVNRACLIADFYVKNSQFDLGIELFNSITQAYPESEIPLIGLGDLYTKMGQSGKAKRYYTKAQKLTGKGSD